MFNRFFNVILYVIAFVSSDLMFLQCTDRYNNIAIKQKTEQKNILFVFPENESKFSKKYSIKLLNKEDVFLINGIEPCDHLEYKINQKSRTVAYVNFFTSRCDELRNIDDANTIHLLTQARCFKRFLKGQELLYVILSKYDDKINFNELFAHLKSEEDIFIDGIGINTFQANGLQRLDLNSVDQLNGLLKSKLKTCTINDIFGNCLKDITLEIKNKNTAKINTNNLKKRSCCK